MISFVWEDPNNHKVIQLREKFKLTEIISNGRNEFEKQLLLKEWVNDTLPRGTPQKNYAKESAFEIILDARKGRPMYCTQYAFAFLQCGTALGWYTRKLGVDTDHDFGGEEMHHGVIDI